MQTCQLRFNQHPHLSRYSYVYDNDNFRDCPDDLRLETMLARFEGVYV
jgi:hypothetical protein